MTWFQLKILHCPTDKVELVSEELEEMGALSVMLTDKEDNPVLEPAPGTTPLWPEVIMQVLYSQANEANDAAMFIKSKYPVLETQMEVIEDRDWERVWMDDFKPQRFGSRLWICPSWANPPDPKAVNLMLDPGLAFGTGTHPTTALCLSWLDQADLTGKNIIDYGCGSGILSLASLKLGAAKVYAVDIDEQALQATQNNAQTNQLNLNQLAISQPEVLTEPVDIILANILLDPLMSLKYRFQELLKPNGVLVVSGILEEQISTLTNAYDAVFTPIHHECIDGWALIIFARS